MAKVKYKGSADRRSIDANSWKKVGVEDQNKVVWTPDSVQEVSDAAANYILSKDSANFEAVEEKEPSSNGDDDTSTRDDGKGQVGKSRRSV